MPGSKEPRQTELDTHPRGRTVSRSLVTNRPSLVTGATGGHYRRAVALARGAWLLAERALATDAATPCDYRRAVAHGERCLVTGRPPLATAAAAGGDYRCAVAHGVVVVLDGGAVDESYLLESTACVVLIRCGVHWLFLSVR